MMNFVSKMIIFVSKMMNLCVMQWKISKMTEGDMATEVSKKLEGMLKKLEKKRKAVQQKQEKKNKQQEEKRKREAAVQV